MPTLKAAGFNGFAISEDGKTIQMAFGADKAGELILLTMPTAGLPEHAGHVRALLDALRMAKVLPPGEAVPATPMQTFAIKNSALGQMAHVTALVINEGLATEAFVLMPDLQALKMADAIQQKVFFGMSAEEQRKMLKAVEGERPQAPRLIMPAGHA